jgi:hypothetical protein
MLPYDFANQKTATSFISISANQLEKASGFPIENMKQLSFCFQHATRDVFFVIFSG